MPYIDGYVLPIPTRKLDEYKSIARKAGKVWMEHGALAYRECVGEDLKPGIGTPFPAMTGAKRGETVIFSFIVYKSRAHRDRVNKKAMEDPRLQAMCADAVPFDVNRMAYGGFTTIVDLSAEA